MAAKGVFFFRVAQNGDPEISHRAAQRPSGKTRQKHTFDTAWHFPQTQTAPQRQTTPFTKWASPDPQMRPGTHLSFPKNPKMGGHVSNWAPKFAKGPSRSTRWAPKRALPRFGRGPEGQSSRATLYLFYFVCSGRHVRLERRVTLLPYVDFTERAAMSAPPRRSERSPATLWLLFTVFMGLVVTTKPPR